MSGGKEGYTGVKRDIRGWGWVVGGAGVKEKIRVKVRGGVRAGVRGC